MTDLVRLIYSSAFTDAARRRGAFLLPEMLEKAAENNRRVHVTGVLLAFNEVFLQALEGSPAAVDAVFERVRGDRRHSDVKVLDRSAVSAREFGLWAMCGRGISPTDNAILGILALKPGLRMRALSGPEALRLLRAVSAIQARTPQHA